MRWLAGLLLFAVGTALGLTYGWKVNPLKLSDTTPAALRVDYRTDYVLMVAEAYHAQADSEVARRQLAILGGQAPGVICEQALQQARQASYSAADLSLLQQLLRAMQAVAPDTAPATSAP